MEGSLTQMDRNEEMNEQELSTIAAEVAHSQPEAAEVSGGRKIDPRVDDLERRIRDLEAAIGDLRTVSASGASASAPSGRKTQTVYTPRFLAKGAEPVSASGVDAALGSLSVEQRLAVKAGLLRAGLL